MGKRSNCFIRQEDKDVWKREKEYGRKHIGRKIYRSTSDKTGSTTDIRYKMASVVGILIFVVVAALSLIIYNVLPSTRNEEDYK